MSEIDDPFKPSDATVLRPRPGAGRRGGGDPLPPSSRPPGVPPGGGAGFTEPVAASARDLLGVGLNPLVQAASPLLMLAGQMRGTLSAPEVGDLRRHALEEIRRFEERARAGGVSGEVTRAARYALCASLDEAVLSTPWGAQSDWAQQTLLVALHREAWGGEKFFEMLERISQDPAQHIDLMELQYLCIALGFAGKYQVVDRGHARLADVQQDLYRKIRQHRGTAPADLSLRWRGLQDKRNPLIRYVPWWVVGAAALAILAIAFVTYYARLGRFSAPVESALAGVGLEEFGVPHPVAAPVGMTVKQLLAPEEAKGTMRVDEDGGKTTITLLAADLFASGSASVNPAYDDTLRKVGEALEKVPGRVLVTGHTDDQALRSFRYRDNFELSRERALSVLGILKPAIRDSGRLESTGYGSSQPKYRPESTPENRARNRRVEIIHVRES
ncbi:MAG TPA: type IVB secretion system protein IcmH/DotU [Vicinamibacterales bacterium]|nr:type IVB secretion system protein IcmH/DotU [Vicinamibacterales bacterium]